jgi:hypothetical protein
VLNDSVLGAIRTIEPLHDQAVFEQENSTWQVSYHISHDPLDAKDADHQYKLAMTMANH